MNWSRRWSALVLLLALVAPQVRGQPPANAKDGTDLPVDKWLIDRTLTVTPAAAPVPVLKYRLYPSFSDRKPGNAVPIYLRLAHERSDAWKKLLLEKPDQWNKLPLEKLPLAEVKEFLDKYKYNFRQLELGARRTTADWSYTLDAGDPIGLLLPDAQEMRLQARLLVLKARVEIAEGRYADAARTLETGFSFSQQVSETPFLISGLVGIACASQLADCLIEMMERPDAPNLYWALAVLPRPLIDLRRGHEFEQTILELQFTPLADLGRPRAPAEWDAALRQVRREVERFGKLEPKLKPVKPGNATGDPASASPDLPAARKYLTEVVGTPAAQVATKAPAEVLLLFISHYYHDLRDDVFKAAYLPFPEGWPQYAESDKRLKSAPDSEAARLALLLLPAVLKVQLAPVRRERRLTILRVLEALRLHAAANGGQLPDALEKITVTPVPNDPGTGRPFEYRLDGQTATLTSQIASEPRATTGLRYRVTMRK